MRWYLLHLAFICCDYIYPASVTSELHASLFSAAPKCQSLISAAHQNDQDFQLQEQTCQSLIPDQDFEEQVQQVRCSVGGNLASGKMEVTFTESQVVGDI